MTTIRHIALLLLLLRLPAQAQSQLHQHTEVPPPRVQQAAPGTPLPVGTTTLEQAIGLPENTHFHFTKPITIAIIDDAFDLDNPLWAGHIAHNTAEIPDNDLDDDHNGKTDDYAGWDFGDNDNEVRPARTVVDKESHGTRVLGVYWQLLQKLSGGDLSLIRILPIKAVSDIKMNNYLKEGYKGIEYAIQQQADIILCSWSGPLMAPEERAVIEKAREKGILIVAAAGNFYALNPLYPGAVPWVTNVAAVDRSGRKLPVSNYGMFVDICAPGDSLPTYDPYRTAPTAHLSATSAAAPVVAAVITAIRSARPDLPPSAIDRLIKNTAVPLDDRNPLYAGNLGAGMINIAGILAALQGAAPGSRTYHQAQAYIDLQQCNASAPVRIAPSGHYRDIRLLLQPATAGSTGLPDLRVHCYRPGQVTDTTIRSTDLKYPLVLHGDSIELWRSSPKQAGRSWLYYQVSTIDSSILYCGGSPTAVSGTEGYIEDGSGTENYTGRNDCKWQITAPPGKQIRITFDQFDTEPKADQVYLFNGNSTRDPILAIFSGHKIPPPVTSWGNSVLIWFITNEENCYQGWRLHYKVLDAEKPTTTDKKNF